MTDLPAWSFELDGFRFGWGTRYHVTAWDFDAPDMRGNSSDVPRGDGRRWGRSYRSGRAVTFELTVGEYSPPAAQASAAVLEAAWDAPDVRSTPGAVSCLRYRWADEVRRVYGRPGKIAPATTTMGRSGRIDYTCDFDTVDHLFYADDVAETVVPFVPNVLGGLVGPQTGGWAATTAGTASGRVPVGGSAPAWLVWTIHGPIVNPTIEVVGQWSATLQMTLAYDQSVTVDPTPWDRSVRRNDGASFAGAFTADSVRLSLMRVPPGDQQVLLRGIDPSGTSSLRTAVRAAHSSY